MGRVLPEVSLAVFDLCTLTRKMGKPVSVTIKNPEEITILATGGTIDKFYSVAGTMDNGEPAAKDLLDRVITDVQPQSSSR